MYAGIQMILKYTNTPFVYRNSLTIDQESPSWLTTSSPRQASPLWSTGRLALGCGRLIRQQGDRSHEKKSIYVYMYNYVYIYTVHICICICICMIIYIYMYDVIYNFTRMDDLELWRMRFHPTKRTFTSPNPVKLATNERNSKIQGWLHKETRLAD